MSILKQLSSQVGDRTEAANRVVAARCLQHPALLVEIAEGLNRQDAALVGDCAQVLTKVAEERPEWVAPYAQALSPLLTHQNTRIRWEATHALALVAALTPQVIASQLPRLGEMIRVDTSTIARDYAVDAIGNYARTSRAAAVKAYPLLKGALKVWDGKHAAHALKGLANVALAAPSLRNESHAIARRYLDSDRGVVRKAAKELIRAVESA